MGRMSNEEIKRRELAEENIVQAFVDIGAIVTFKEDSRLGYDYLSINEFVGVMRGYYNPQTRKWDRKKR